ncbi:hypothetical protein PITC_027560 [Penicillium italicum]|uniref:Uncharacterized protein n=1 Tax=Penicillium italicum TaxID=40296 RepID=A0A0A2KXT8_PENIT|nr:hypothetical protein PITC_027560 [Penicillium italicum]
MKNEESGMIIFELNGWKSAVISNSISMVADQVTGCRQTKGYLGENGHPHGE